MIRMIPSAAMLLCSGLILFALYLAQKRNIFQKSNKALAILLGLLFFYAHLYREAAVYDVRALDMYSPFGADVLQTAVAILLLWFTYAVTLCAVLGAFFPYRALQNILRFFAPVILLLDLILLPTYLTARLGTKYAQEPDLLFFLVILEIALTIALTATAWARDRELPCKKDVGSMLLALPFAVIAIMPAFVPQALIGFLDPAIKIYDMSETHRFMLYLAVIIPVVIFQCIKNKSEDVKRFLMIYLSIALLFTFLGRWELADWKDPLDWPLHLCHTAMLLIPLCLIFRMQRLFNFCLFINVIGAVLAMTIPGELDGLNALGTERVSFWINHWAAFFMPILLVSLKLFRRPKLKEWCFAVCEFCVYFFAILFVNAWLSNYGSCDFFYLNSDFVVSNLGKWAEDTQKIVFSFQYKDLTFTFMPLYQALFFVIYLALTVGVWFLYALLFSTWDAAQDRREKERAYKMMKKSIKEFLHGRNINEPLSGDDSPRLVLRNFSKRYGTNGHYSVYNVSFDVKGGEIFGFLGPNGAGKSTIIKSIVGIQPLSEGNIEICGYDTEKQAVQAKLQIGYVPDHYALYENLTGREYINYIADLYRVDKDYRDKTIQKYVERFQLVDSFDNQMKTYSHGMKQKITIMAALVHNPKVWILDEPLTGLDPNSIHEVKECMKEHAAAGNIVFFSSHIIDVVEKICDRIAIIRKGRLCACTRISDLEDAGIELEQFYLSSISAEDEGHVPYTGKHTHTEEEEALPVAEEEAKVEEATV